MNDDLLKELTEARRTIDQQTVELDELRQQLADARFADALRQILLVTANTSAIASATSDVTLDAIVETAASVINVRAASLFLIDEERQDLVFQVSLGEKAVSTKQFRVPLGRGIAGYVAVTGQPIAVADTQQDSRFASDLAQATGFVPKSILCVPLYLGDRVIGVLELLDKTGGATFSPEDMDILLRFARLAAQALDQSRLTYDLRRLFRVLLTDVVQNEALTEPIARFADGAALYAEHTDAFALAHLIHQIEEHGDAGRRLAIDVLTSVASFLRTTHQTVRF